MNCFHPEDAKPEQTKAGRIARYMAGESSRALGCAYKVSNNFVFLEAKKRGIKKGRRFARGDKWRSGLIDAGKVTGALPEL